MTNAGYPTIAMCLGNSEKITKKKIKKPQDQEQFELPKTRPIKINTIIHWEKKKKRPHIGACHFANETSTT